MVPVYQNDQWPSATAGIKKNAAGALKVLQNLPGIHHTHTMVLDLVQVDSEQDSLIVVEMMSNQCAVADFLEASLLCQASAASAQFACVAGFLPTFTGIHIKLNGSWRR